MELNEFISELKKDYAPDKFWDYVYASFFSAVGIFFIYLIFFSSWSNNLSQNLYILILTGSFLLIFYGIIGFLRIPTLPQVFKVGEFFSKEEAVNAINMAARKLNLKPLPFKNTHNLLYFQTEQIIFMPKEAAFFIDSKGKIFVNVRQTSFRNPTFIGVSKCRSIKDKISQELKA